MKSLALWLLSAGLLLGSMGVAHAQYAQQNPTTSRPAPRQNTPSASPNQQNATPTAAPQAYPGPAAAGEANNAQNNGNLVTYSGCLREGAGADEYALYGQGTDYWELKSQSVDLSAYVGQTVMVTAVQTSPQEGNPLMVTRISTVTTSCSW